MRIQVSTGVIKATPAEKAAEQLVRAGFFSLQLSAAHTEADIPALGRLKEQHGLEYTVHAPFPNRYHGPIKTRLKGDEVKALTLASIENARILECPLVVAHAGYSHGNYRDELDAALRNLRECADAADGYGIELCVENTDQLNTPEGLVRSLSVIERLAKSGFRLCLDTSHARTICSTDAEVLDALERFLPSVGCIHLVDYRPNGDTIKDHFMPGMGVIDVGRFLSITKDFKGYVVYEPYSCTLEEVVAYDRRFRALIKGGSC